MSKKILLFLPGYYGSVLKEESTKKVRWANASNFFFSQTGISENIPQTKIGSTNKLVVGGVLENVKIIPSLWDVDVYASTMKQLSEFAKAHNMQLDNVGYDWRDDFVSIIQVIDQRIKSYQLAADDELYVVAHSMGALLMAYYVRYGAQDVEHAVENWAGLKQIKKIALIAPPLHGLMILFRDIETGTSQGLNRTLLSGKDYSTFKSSYFFLPPKGEDIGLRENGEKLSLGIHDIAKWEKNKWGPFKFASDEEIPHVRAFVEKYMKRSEKFHELMRAKVETPPSSKLPMLQIRGLGVKTLELATIKETPERINYSFKKADAVDGDGTVTSISGMSLAFFRVFDFTERVEQLGHLDVLAKPESQKMIQDFLINDLK